MTDETINEFVGEYRFLSNFYPSPIRCAGVVWPTVEHGYQASKTDDPLWRGKILQASTPGSAKWHGRQAPIRSDWLDVRIKVMRFWLTKKFLQNDELYLKLCQTGSAHLVEGNSWNDTFWGVSNETGIGENWLGQLLMELRTELQSSTATDHDNGTHQADA